MFDTYLVIRAQLCQTFTEVKSSHTDIQTLIIITVTTVVAVLIFVLFVRIIVPCIHLVIGVLLIVQSELIWIVSVFIVDQISRVERVDRYQTVQQGVIKILKRENCHQIALQGKSYFSGASKTVCVINIVHISVVVLRPEDTG